MYHQQSNKLSYFYHCRDYHNTVFQLSVKQADDANDFGDSWSVEYRKCPPSAPPTDPCEDNSDALRQARDLCWTLLDPDGRHI